MRYAANSTFSPLLAACIKKLPSSFLLNADALLTGDEKMAATRRSHESGTNTRL